MRKWTKKRKKKIRIRIRNNAMQMQMHEEENKTNQETMWLMDDKDVPTVISARNRIRTGNRWKIRRRNIL